MGIYFAGNMAQTASAMTGAFAGRLASVGCAERGVVGNNIYSASATVFSPCLDVLCPVRVSEESV